MIRLLTSAIAGLLLAISASAEPEPPMPHPDFTKGDSIPDETMHDWTLGATGARGWMYYHQLDTSKARQIYITKVANDSPATGILEIGDVILGIGEDKFSDDPRIAFGKALTQAESEDGVLPLIRWRKGVTEPITLTVPVLGYYKSTTPFACSKSRRILSNGCDALAKKILTGNYSPNPICRSLNGLALLASGDPKHNEIIRQEAQWAAYFSANGFQTWHYGYVISFVAEYIMATGDMSLMPDLKRLALEAANGQSIVGSWGHGFAGEDGRLVGYGMMNAPGIPLTIGLVLARKAGVDDAIVATAIERSAKLLRFYSGKGAIPYGDHQPWIQTHEDNGKCGMAAVLFNLLGEPEETRFFSRMSLAAHGQVRDTGHTGNFWNLTWAMPGIVQSGEHATAAWMKEFGAWYFDLARQHDGTFPHQGYGTPGWDATGAYLLAYAMPLQKIHLTGKEEPTMAPIDAQTAAAIIEDGRGWTHSDRTSYYDDLSVAELMKRLGSWSPVVRERAAIALSRSDRARPTTVMRLLKTGSIEERLGACQALQQMGPQAAQAVSTLRRTLDAEDMWLRIMAARALGAIGTEAQPAAKDILNNFTRELGADDPRGMEQRYLCHVLFAANGGLLGESFEDIDRKRLFAAIRAGLQNQDGRARGSIASAFKRMSERDHLELLPELYQAVVDPAPSGIMFADQIRLQSLELLAKYKVKEGIDAGLFYLQHQNHWGSEKRTPELTRILISYGAHAQRVIPDLETLAASFKAGMPPDFPRALNEQKAEEVLNAIATIKASTELPELISIH